MADNCNKPTEEELESEVERLHNEWHKKTEESIDAFKAYSEARDKLRELRREIQRKMARSPGT